MSSRTYYAEKPAAQLPLDGFGDKCACGCGTRFSQHTGPGRPRRYVDNKHRARDFRSRAWAAAMKSVYRHKSEIEPFADMLGKTSDAVIAGLTGAPVEAVRDEREARGIPEHVYAPAVVVQHTPKPKRLAPLIKSATR